MELNVNAMMENIFKTTKIVYLLAPVDFMLTMLIYYALNVFSLATIVHPLLSALTVNRDTLLLIQLDAYANLEISFTSQLTVLNLALKDFILIQ